MAFSSATLCLIALQVTPCNVHETHSTNCYRQGNEATVCAPSLFFTCKLLSKRMLMPSDPLLMLAGVLCFQSVLIAEPTF